MFEESSSPVKKRYYYYTQKKKKQRYCGKYTRIICTKMDERSTKAIVHKLQRRHDTTTSASSLCLCKKRQRASVTPKKHLSSSLFLSYIGKRQSTHPLPPERVYCLRRSLPSKKINQNIMQDKLSLHTRVKMSLLNQQAISQMLLQSRGKVLLQPRAKALSECVQIDA